MAAIGHIAMVGDSNQHSIMMQLHNQNSSSLSRLTALTDNKFDTFKHLAFSGDKTNTYDYHERHRSSSDGNSDSHDEGDVEMSDQESIVEIEDATERQTVEEDESMAVRERSETPIKHDSNYNDFSVEPKSPSSLSMSNIPNQNDQPESPKINIAPALSKSTNFSIDHILKSDFGSSAKSSLINSRQTSSQTKDTFTHRKFDFSIEALAANCWSQTESRSTYFKQFSPPTSRRNRESSPTASLSPGSSTSSISPHLTQYSPPSKSSSSAIDAGLSPLRTPLTSPNTSPPRHYRPSRSSTGGSASSVSPISPYSCTPSVFQSLQHQTQHHHHYFQQLLTATATSHEMLASPLALAAGYNPYASAASTILNHRFPITDKLSTNDRRDKICFNKAKRALSPLNVDSTNSHVTSSSLVQPDSTHTSRTPTSASSRQGNNTAGRSLAAPVVSHSRPSTPPSTQPKRPTAGISPASSNEDGEKSNNEKLWPAWVYCTRYSDRPSSGPRSRKSKKKKEKNLPSKVLSSSLAEEKRPRTAFTNEQLARLRREFEDNRYLTEDRRQNLARELQLNESQIKIWFQNKRAKMKKSTGNRNALALQLMAQGLYNHSTADNNNMEK